MSGTEATDRQLATIKTEARKAGFDDPQDAASAAGIESRNWMYDLSRPDASDLIQQLRGGLTPPEKPAPAVWTETGDGMSAADAISALGHTVSVIGAVSGKTFEMEVREIKLYPDEGPALAGYYAGTVKRLHIALINVGAWGFLDVDA